MTGPKMIEAREALDLSIAQLAHIIGVQRQAVVRWENGKRPIPQTVTNIMRWLSNGFKPEEFEK